MGSTDSSATRRGGGTRQAHWRVPRDVFFQEVDGAVVLLNLRDATYYGLDAVGSCAWRLLCQHGDLERVVAALLAEYEVAEERLRQDLHAFVAELHAAGLLEEGDAGEG